MNTISTAEEIKMKLKSILANDLEANIRPGNIEDDVSLYEDGIGLDSISIVNFIVLIENKFGISFDEKDLNYELFSSLNNLARVIGEKFN